ncbi:MAG: hypothetical protein A2086_11760 [Spirochaetes bacterium GWD1_27_9]|nr:MAG: hypothetical protein A2Y34_16660 [Spirochaetes bacterium GWC1_27_15]OHD28637.1 MAG: hypothetical protein A2086_11760 [Spirochaetes bacterium GWD1_27_9]
MDQENLAPIVLFVYNRLSHTKKTIEYLKKNFLASKSDLFIYSDGAKTDNDNLKVEELRNYLKTIDGFKEVNITERPKNMGLANSVIAGVTEIINKFGKVIVVEDDLISTPNFLDFMNQCLDEYQTDKKVFSVTGYVYPHKTIKNYKFDVILFPRASTWGWGTWKDRWDKADWEVKDFDEFINNEKLCRRFNRGGDDMTGMLKSQMEGTIKSWGIRWCYAHFKNNAYGVFPTVSKIQNTGYDGSGSNCGDSDDYVVELDTNNTHFKLKRNIKPDAKIIENIKAVFNKNDNNKDFFMNIIKKLLKKVKRVLFTILRINYNPMISSYNKICKKYKNAKRFTMYNIDFFKYKFVVPDCASFLFMIKEIMINEIYKLDFKDENILIYDCGANIGISAIYFKKHYPNAKIRAYEADPKIFSILKENLKVNNINDVDLIQKVVWTDYNGVSFSSEGADGGSIYGDKNLVKIDSLRLRDEIDKEQTIDLLKMDIEGAEVDVLKDCESVLSKISNIFIEYHSFLDRKQELDTILSILSKNNFRYIINPASDVMFAFVNKKCSDVMDFQINIFAFKSNVR